MVWSSGLAPHCVTGLPCPVLFFGHELRTPYTVVPMQHGLLTHGLECSMARPLLSSNPVAVNGTEAVADIRT